MPAETRPFVLRMLGHLVRAEDNSNVALCGAIAPHSPMPDGARCRECGRVYLRIMTATDELVGLFGETGELREGGAS